MTSAAPIWVHDLPSDHIFRLVHRSFDIRDGVFDFHRFDDLCRPVDWDAVSARLRTREGRDEATQWVRTGRSAGRTLLHELCEFNIGRGVENDRRGPGLCTVLPIDGPTSLRVLREVMAVIPDAVRTPDLEGYYPLHRVCARRPRMEGSRMSVTLQWSQALVQVFELIYDEHPDAATVIVGSDGMTALHLVVSADHSGHRGGPRDENEASHSRGTIFRTLLRAFPAALRVRDADGCLPLHIAAFNYQDSEVIREMVTHFPQAIQDKCVPDSGRTPLLRFLRSCRNMGEGEGVSMYDVAREMLHACPPGGAEVEDDEVLRVVGKRVLQQAGDALDYSCLNYCEALDLDWISSHQNSEDEDSEDEDEDDDPFAVAPYRGSYVEANERALDAGIFDPSRVMTMMGSDDHVEAVSTWEQLSDEQRLRAHEIDMIWNVLLMVLWAMDRRGQAVAPDLMPLHACVRGQMCRPWNLVVMENVLWHFYVHASVADPVDGNLPLHLFLESCMGQRERALRKGFVRDAAEYDRAVTRCFRMLLEVYPGAAGRLSSVGRFPLHIAIEKCGHLPYQDVIEPLLNGVSDQDGRLLFSGHPQALAARDVQRNGLYPFAAAAVGDGANLDLIYSLLRSDPSMLAQSQSTELP